jgi:hypothetical protein
MAYVHFSKSAPCGFLVVKTGGDPSRYCDTILFQTDLDFPAVASRMGWGPCHDCTDGTVDCDVCGNSADSMIAEAGEHIRDREGMEYPGLDDYFDGSEWADWEDDGDDYDGSNPADYEDTDE